VDPTNRGLKQQGAHGDWLTNLIAVASLTCPRRRHLTNRSEPAGRCAQPNRRTDDRGSMVAVLFFLAPLVHLMPQATLAVVVIIPCAGMIKLPDFRAIWRTRFMEFSWPQPQWWGGALGTLNGILVAVILSMLALIYHAASAGFRPRPKAGTDVFAPVQGSSGG